MPQNQIGYLQAPWHGRYYETANAARLFAGGNQAAVATALASGRPTTYTGGLILYNPIASTVQLAINYVSLAFVVAQTNASTISLGIGQSSTAPSGTLTTVASVPTSVGSSATANAVLYSSASVTLPVAPYLALPLTTVDTGALTVAINGGNQVFDIGGTIILQPGAFACFLSSAAGTADSFLGGFVWEETAIGSD